MDLVPPPVFRGQRILIVESEVPFVRYLQEALEQEGAETLAVSDPYSDAGAERIASFTVCAAAINSVHRSVAKALDVPVLIYGVHMTVPAQTDAIVRALKEMLSERR